MEVARLGAVPLDVLGRRLAAVALAVGLLVAGLSLLQGASLGEVVQTGIAVAIAAVPEQWVILQRVWPATPPDPVRVFPVGSPLESDLLKRVDDLLPPRRD